jgi:hypothetical protein
VKVLKIHRIHWFFTKLSEAICLVLVVWLHGKVEWAGITQSPLSNVLSYLVLVAAAFVAIVVMDWLIERTLTRKRTLSWPGRVDGVWVDTIRESRTGEAWGGSMVTFTPTVEGYEIKGKSFELKAGTKSCELDFTQPHPFRGIGFVWGDDKISYHFGGRESADHQGVGFYRFATSDTFDGEFLFTEIEAVTSSGLLRGRAAARLKDVKRRVNGKKLSGKDNPEAQLQKYIEDEFRQKSGR